MNTLSEADLDRYETALRDRLAVVEVTLAEHSDEVLSLANALQRLGQLDFMLTTDPERLLLWLCVERVVLNQSLERITAMRLAFETEVPHGE